MKPPALPRLTFIALAAAMLTSCGGGGGGDSGTGNASNTSSASTGSSNSATTSTTGSSSSSTTTNSNAGSTPPAGVFISEVANNYFSDSVSWLEIYNNSGAEIDLASYSLRSPALNLLTSTTAGAITFTLPSVKVPNQSHVVIGGRTSSDLVNTSRNVYVVDVLNNVPFWQGSGGFVELQANGKTVDFMRFGSSTATPASSDGWSGASIAAMNTKPDSYNTSLVRLASSFKQSKSAADWTLVNFATPGGPNDVAAGVVDSDLDGIPDSAKLAGGRFAGLDLYAMGARKGQRDLFIQVDYMDSTDPGVTPHAPALDKVVQAFKAQGIAVHFDAGDLVTAELNPDKHNLSGSVSNKRPFAACTKLASPSATTTGCGSAYAVKSAYMDIRRKPVFRYLLMANSQNIASAATGNLAVGPSGVAELLGDDFLVTLGGWNLQANSNVLINFQASTIMHELGHTLGLRHGGDEDQNSKPNYFSVMNYFYQLTGLPDPAGAGVGQRYYYYRSNYTSQPVPGYGVPGSYPEASMDAGPLSASFRIDFSNGKGGALDESALLESSLIGRGTSSGQYADWNLNAAQDSKSQSSDINGSGGQSVLKDYDDWSNVVLNSRRYYYANNTGQTPPNVLGLNTRALDPITSPFQATLQEAIPPLSILRRLGVKL